MSLDDLQVFYREATAVRTELVAYLADVDGDTTDVTLRGQIEGPLAAHAKTLPLQVPFEAGRTAGRAVMSTAVLNETCFWEPGAPHWYRLRVSLRHGDDVIDEVERIVGVRPLSVAAGGLRLNGRPYVVRAASSANVTDDAREACLAEKVALAVEVATDADLSSASEMGLPLIACVGGTAAEVTAELHRLARWPAVVLAIVDLSEQLPASLQLECPNVLLAETTVRGRPTADWAHLAIVDEASEIDVSRLAELVIRRLSGQAGDLLGERIAVAAAFEPDADETADHGQVVGCIV